jgi:hypothetical protein
MLPLQKPAPSRQGLAMLAVKESIHERTAALLLMSESARKRAVATPRSSSPAADMHFQRDRAALILVYEADRLAREDQRTTAIATYRRAIELFPQTHWADVARRRLQDMQT